MSIDCCVSSISDEITEVLRAAAVLRFFMSAKLSFPLLTPAGLLPAAMLKVFVEKDTLVVPD